MQMIATIIHSITSPIRMLFYWIAQLIPGIKRLPNISLPYRVALMTFLFLIITLTAAVVNYISGRHEQAARDWILYLGVAWLLMIAIVVLVFYIVKLLMIRDESRFPDIERAWSQGLQLLNDKQIYIDQVPLYLVIGAKDRRRTTSLMRASQIGFSVEATGGDDQPLYWYANNDAVFLFLNGCNCLSRLASNVGVPVSAPSESGSSGSSTNVTGTIQASTFGGAASGPASPMATLQDNGVGNSVAQPAPQPDMGFGGGGATMNLPPGQNLADIMPQAKLPNLAAGPQISSQQIHEQAERMGYLCQLLRKARPSICPINGILTILPFDLVDNAGSQVQTAVQKDLSVLREKLSVRCPATVLVSDMEKEDGFQELVNRVGEHRAREFRFGKGCELWGVAAVDRLQALAVHATGAFEDWIYMLFQEENALKRRYNSRLFSLLCKTRGRFAKSLQDILGRGFGVDVNTPPAVAESPFLFGGCYFAATGADPDRQAFVKSVLLKVIQQDGELEWSASARRADESYQLLANLFALVGFVAIAATIAMVIYQYWPAS